ncbi:TonB-dependent siderophore receptor [Denitrobaculum tricleocarpae]|uniref:TonB-dependent receptor n=1 Tax=Denitrobaculum tricleocarpae TaxID=2591009 RepID=A0A545TKV4_9PROT|nr:TonB-dependent receptor [Denitrobaculum tricleocarpae]TQV77860.1 TonB-dependent receptor [Denitrobaculum tricleocarpae]
MVTTYHAMARGAVASAALAAFSAAPALAQNENTPVELDPVVVEEVGPGETPAGPVEGWRAPTADGPTRTRTPLWQIPQSVQVLPRQLIEEQDAQSVADVLRNVPGVVVSRDDEIFLSPPILRGFEARNFYDGQPAFGFTNSADPLSTIQVERVEVIKGPSGALFGGGVGAPLGGIINVIRKRPDPDGFFGSVEADGGSFGNRGIGADVNAPLVEGGRVRFRMQAEYRREDGFIDDLESEQVNLFPAVEADITEDTTASLLGFYGERDFIEYPGLPAAAVTYSGFDEEQFPGALNPPESHAETYSLQAFIEHEMNQSWRIHGSFQYVSDSFEENDSFADSAFFDLDTSDTLFPVITGQLTNDVEQFNGNLWTTADFTTGIAKHRLLIGVEADRTDYEATTTFLPTFGVIDLLNPVRPAFTPLPATLAPGTTADILSRSASIYAQDQITLWEDLHLTASLRYTRLKTEDRSDSGAGTVKNVHKEATPRVGIAYDVTQEVTIFAGYGEGFEQPLFVTPVAGESPVPETSKQIEAGVKFDLDAGLSGSLAVFQIERQNVPVNVSISGQPRAQRQSGEQRARGVEAEVLWQPMPEVSLLANFTYQQAEVTEDTELPVGDRLVRVPQSFGRLAAQYRFLEGEAKGLSLGAGLTASSGAEATLPNSFETDGFSLVDARVGYELGPAKLSVSVENLFDEEYFVPYGFFNNTVAPGQPRTFLATLRVKF